MHRFFRNTTAVAHKEISGYFTSPVAYVFIVIFLLICGFFTFFVERLFEGGQADLRVFFQWHPWFYLFMVPAVAMRLWADERRSGTIELTLTLPLTLTELVFGKFVAAWIFIGVSLVLTFPLVFTVAYLGDPDFSAISSAYFGSFLMAGAFLSIGCMTSSVTRNQIISFIFSWVLCLFLVMAGWESVTDIFSGWAPGWLMDVVAGLSFFPHFTSMARGVIDGRDLLYFTSVILLMLFINGVILHHRRRTLSATVMLAVILMLLINAVFSGVNFRWDTTEKKVYSLSSGTKNILSHLTYPVTIKFYFSRSNIELPVEYKLFANRAWEFLSEYARASAGKITLERYDPKPDSEEEEWAGKFGLNAMRTESGSHVFCGLVFLQADIEGRIGWLNPGREETLEYDLSRMIHQSQSAEKKIMGVVSYLPVFGQAVGDGMNALVSGNGVNSNTGVSTGRVWSFIDELQKIYEVRKVAVSTDAIDPAIDLLVVIHPKDMHPDLRFAIDQFVLSGGKVLFFVDPLSMSDTGSQDRKDIAGTDRSTKDLFSAWGVFVDFGKVVGDLDMAGRGTSSGADAVNPLFIAASATAFNRTNLVTSKLESMLFPMAGVITKLENSDVVFEPLIQSGTNAALMTASQVNGDPETLRRQLTPTGERYNLAVLLRGRFKTAFPEGPPALEPPVDSKRGVPSLAAPLKTSNKTATMILVADADLLADQYYLRDSGYYGYRAPEMVNDNLNFFLNACEALTGSDDLISLRSRGRFERPFTRVIEIERAAQEKWHKKETELTQRVETIRQELRELESLKTPNQQTFGLSPKQQAQIEQMRSEHQRIDRELKVIRKSLRSEVEMLGGVLKTVNILLMPLMVALAGIGYGVYRQRKMKRR
jgi:ABC-type uncharacterized transport system involved in gliding motility auxiliary subunit